MKLALFLCLISASALAQKNGDLIKKYIRHGKDSTVDFQYYYKPDKSDTLGLDWSPYNFSKDKPKNFPSSDSLDMEFGWDDIFRSAGWDCRCPLSPEQVQQMPRELSPYKWVNKNKPIYLNLDTAELKSLLKNRILFIDSTQLKKKKPTSL